VSTNSRLGADRGRVVREIIDALFSDISRRCRSG
jgi:hypothetical protein